MAETTTTDPKNSPQVIAARVSGKFLLIGGALTVAGSIAVALISTSVKFQSEFQSKVSNPDFIISIAKDGVVSSDGALAIIDALCPPG